MAVILFKNRRKTNISNILHPVESVRYFEAIMDENLNLLCACKYHVSDGFYLAEYSTYYILICKKYNNDQAESECSLTHFKICCLKWSWYYAYCKMINAISCNAKSPCLKINHALRYLLKYILKHLFRCKEELLGGPNVYYQD